MGLLDRVLSDPEIEVDKNSINNHKENFSEKFQETRKLLTSYQDGGDELLNKSFNKICELFDITKGAFFLLDKEKDILKINQLRGYDVTTSNRIRFSKNLIESLSIIKSSYLECNHFNKLENLFSTREFSLIENIFISPVRFAEEGIIALFFITESTAFEMAGRLESSFEELNFILAPLLYHNFIKPVTPLKNTPKTLTFYNDSKNEIIDEIEKRYINENIVLVVINYISLIDLDLQKGLSILKLLNSITGERVSTFDLGRSRAMMIYPESLFPDKDLFEQQLSISLQRILNITENLPPYEVKYLIYSHDSSNSLKDYIINATNAN